jgi:hypothetical protein
MIKDETVKIDLGEIFYLDMEIVQATPCPEIFIGARRRIDPGPPTTRALAEAVARWREKPESKPIDGAVALGPRDRQVITTI